jgi:FAD/FMN-containing dehydrogenase
VLDRIVAEVRDAAHARRVLDIRGGGTKTFYGEAPRGEALELGQLTGISSYEPTELVLTARAGTLLNEIETTLAAHGQCLAFEPPRFGATSPIGGVVAAGLAGPARAAAGAVRDHLLGVTLLDGRGEMLTFGGQVMKNVAGYDVSRVMAGSLGVLGVLLEVSLKVMPLPSASLTLRLDAGETDALALLARYLTSPIPLNATSWHDGQLHLRIAGAATAVESAATRLGGTRLDDEAAAAWWQAVRDQRHAFFRIDDERLAAGERLWRLSVPPTTPALGLDGATFVEWGGAQRWWRTSLSADVVRAQAARVGGHATLIRARDRAGGVFMTPSDAIFRIHRDLKRAFDPAGIFNPGRLYPEL